MSNLALGLFSGACGAIAGHYIDQGVQREINPEDFLQVNPVLLREAKRQQNCCNRLTENIGLVFRKVIGPALTGLSGYCIASGHSSVHVTPLAIFGLWAIVCGNTLQLSARKLLQSYIKSHIQPAAAIDTEAAAQSQVDVAGKGSTSPTETATVVSEADRTARSQVDVDDKGSTSLTQTTTMGPEADSTEEIVVSRHRPVPRYFTFA